MRLLRMWLPADRRALDALVRDRARRFPAEVVRRVERIVDDVRRGGDRAVFRYVRRLDGVTLTRRTLRVPPGAFGRAWSTLTPAQRSGMRRAWANILAFHRRQAPAGYVQRRPYGTLRQVVRPLDRVGIHIPGGVAPLVSTLLMCAGAARAAGVRELVLISPPRQRGRIHDAILAGARLAGIREAYNVGGPMGVAALVFGTASIPPVDKVVGPGNAWTQAAKMVAQGGGGLMGESEIVVVADGTADPSAVAADLLAQAEHTGGEFAALVTPSQPLADHVLHELERQLRTLPRVREAATSLSRLGAVVLVRSMREGLAVADRLAPEHLSVVGRGAAGLARRVRNAGTVLVGPASPVAAADYGAGPNHVLPTSGTARSASGLTVGDFLKTMNVTELTAKGLRSLAPGLAALARLEGLEGHARSLEMKRG